MRISRSLAVGATCALGLTLSVGSVPALADPGARTPDVVGVGSDTVQNIMDFVADGAPAMTGFTAAGGYNSAGNKNRVFNYSATADQNDRAVYGAGGTAITPTVILRAGTNPVKRPNGSGSGLDSLVAQPAAGPFQISYVRSSSKSAFNSRAATAAGVAGWGGGIHAVRIATDDLVMAAATTTNARAVTGDQLVSIYNCTLTDWHDVDASVPAGNVIKPLIPQVGSGTRNSFIADLTTIGGATYDPTGKTCVTTVEENDPASITTLSGTDAPNAVVPFSSGRLDLFNAGYFRTPAFPAGAAINPGIQLLYGTQTADACTAPSAHQAGTFCETRGLYVGWLEKDTSLATPLQPGGTKNWVQTLFYDPSGTPYVAGSAGTGLIQRGGVTPNYADCGVNTGSGFPLPC